jgi:uncharacterized protein YndB with AHSA1/START domain
MLKWSAIVVAGLVGVVALTALVGLLLPKGHRASKTAVIAAPPDAVYRLITDVARFKDWRPELTDVEILPDDGHGLRFREKSSQGIITFRFESLEPGRRVVSRIDDPAQPFGGTWTYDLRAEATGTVLTVTEDGEVYNPIFRVVSKFMSQTATIETYLASLQARVHASAG